jgi:hypothetical protein
MAFFERLAADRFAPTEFTRGPWSNTHQHGGPPSALCAEALLNGGDFRLAQLSIDFVRPVPMTPLRRVVTWVRKGRMRQLAQVELWSGQKLVVEARATLLRRVAVVVPAQAASVVEPASSAAPPSACAPWAFTFFNAAQGYHTAMELRSITGTWGEGPTSCWMRMTMPLIDAELIAAPLRAIIAADAVHGTAPCLDIERHSLINPGLTVVLDRDPVGEWVRLDSESQAQANGVGHMFAQVGDMQGRFGHAMAPLLVAAR